MLQTSDKKAILPMGMKNGIFKDLYTMSKKRKNLIKANIILLSVLLVGLVGILSIILYEKEIIGSHLLDKHNHAETKEANIQGAGSARRNQKAELQSIPTYEEAQAIDLENLREPLCEVKGGGEDTVTVMFYLNGCNLESDGGSASKDIREILQAEDSDQVNFVIETIGTKDWSLPQIASDHAQRFLVDHGELKLVDDTLGKEDVTTPEALSSFVQWSTENYPADRYMLILWNHGGGFIEGFGYNEWGNSSHSLTINEIVEALSDTGVKFDFIGFDACVMSSLEICYALYDYCDYMILSEDFEPASGWYYTDWVTALCENTSISMEELGKIIVDDMIDANERYGESTLALIDQRYIPPLFQAWKTFAYENEAELLASNFSIEVNRTSRALDRTVNKAKNTVDMQEYNITDIMAVVSSIPSSSSKDVALALQNAISYYNCTSDDWGMTGLCITLPYNESRDYQKMKIMMIECGFDKDYIIWLERFGNTDVEYYDFNEFENNWQGWDAIEG